MNKYVNKGDSVYPRSNFLPQQFIDNPASLQSSIATLQNQIRATYSDLHTMIDILQNESDLSEDMKLELRIGIKLARRSALLLGDMQVVQKHKRRLLIDKQRSDGLSLT